MPGIESKALDISLLDLCCGLMAAGMGAIVALDGSPLWRAVRVALVLAVCVCVALTARRARRSGAAAALLTGVAAATAGGTIAISHLTRAGVSPRAVGGLLALGGGLTAAVLGAAVLMSSTRRWRRLLAVPIAAVMAWSVVKPLGAAVYATNVPRPEPGSETPSDRGMEYEEATFKTDDGVKLSGWYIPSSNRAAVVLLHGASSTRSNVLSQAAVLARRGYGVLMFDARGHGRSEGRAMEFGWYGELDTSAAVDYLAARPDVHPGRIGAVGMSMGGEQAIGAMGADERIRAVVAEGATNRVLGDHEWLVDQFGAQGRVQQAVNRFEFALVDLLTEAPEPPPLRRSAAEAAPRPVLLIAAGRVSEEQLAHRSIQAASPETVELWVAPGSGHTGGLRTRPEEWEDRVAGFLDRELAEPQPADDVSGQEESQ